MLSAELEAGSQATFQGMKTHSFSNKGGVVLVSHQAAILCLLGLAKAGGPANRPLPPYWTHFLLVAAVVSLSALAWWYGEKMGSVGSGKHPPTVSYLLARL